jgi:hypothetical protein
MVGFMGASGDVRSLTIAALGCTRTHEFANEMPADGIKHCQRKFGTRQWQLR